MVKKAINQWIIGTINEWAKNLCGEYEWIFDDTSWGVEYHTVLMDFTARNTFAFCWWSRFVIDVDAVVVTLCIQNLQFASPEYFQKGWLLSLWLADTPGGGVLKQEIANVGRWWRLKEDRPAHRTTSVRLSTRKGWIDEFLAASSLEDGWNYGWTREEEKQVKSTMLRYR